MALPDLRSVSYHPKPRIMNFNNKIILCGDYIVNGSLNAAMLSGEIASKRALNYLETQSSHIN